MKANNLKGIFSLGRVDSSGGGEFDTVLITSPYYGRWTIQQVEFSYEIPIETKRPGNCPALRDVSHSWRLSLELTQTTAIT